MEPRDTKAHIHKADNEEITDRAWALKVPKTALFHLLTVIPLRELKSLADKYLGPNKKHPPRS